MYIKYLKRVLDILLSFFALIFSMPLFVALIIIGAIKMKGNPFFIQSRPGKNEKIFRLIKFRTMSDEKDKDGNLLPDEDRLNRYGRILRSASLDELPELFNIFIGDMSIVGPRPLLIEYLPYYSDKEKCRHNIRPGLTGWAQINGRNLVDWNTRLSLDIDYVNNVSFIFDVKIVLKTVKQVLMRSNVAESTGNVEGNLARIRKADLKEKAFAEEK